MCFAPSALVQGLNKSINLLLINQDIKNVIFEQGNIVFPLIRMLITIKLRNKINLGLKSGKMAYLYIQYFVLKTMRSLLITNIVMKFMMRKLCVKNV